MPISFDKIPPDSLTPFTFVEFNSSQAVRNLSGKQPYKILAIGQKSSSGTASPLSLSKVTNETQAAKLFGWGSMLHHMFRYLKLNNTDTESFAIALDEPTSEEAPNKSTGLVEIKGDAKSGGLLSCYIGDRIYQVEVQKGDTSDSLASRLSQRINEDSLSYVVSSSNGSIIDITSKYAGLVGAVQIEFNYNPWESFPEGISAIIVPMSTEGINPDIAAALDVIDEYQYNVIVSPYSDIPNLRALDRFLESRWQPQNPIDGHGFVALDRNLADTSANLNSKQITLLDAEGMLTPSYLFSSALAGVNAMYASIDPARPQQTLEVKGVIPARTPKKREVRDQLLKAGVSTFTSMSGKVFIERLVTSYTKNSLGAKDISYRDVAVKQTLSYLRWHFRNHFRTRYPRHKLASNDARIGSGQAVLTPKTAKAEAVSLFKKWEKLGLVEDIEQFKKELVVEISPNDPNRLSFLLPPNLINQLRVIGAQISFIL